MSEVPKHSKRIEPNAEFLRVTFLTKAKPLGRTKKLNAAKTCITTIVTKGKLCLVE